MVDEVIDLDPVELTPPKKSRKKEEVIEPVPDIEEVESETPEQTERYKWEFRGRQDPKWGVVTKEGLIVGRADNQKIVSPDEVWRLAGLGCSNKEIADWFQIDRETLKYNFHDYIAKGREHMKQRIRMAQIKTAINGNPALLIWLGKQYLGQSDSPHNADDKQPLPWTDD